LYGNITGFVRDLLFGGGRLQKAKCTAATTATRKRHTVEKAGDKVDDDGDKVEEGEVEEKW
jgi:hypothetical protein